MSSSRASESTRSSSRDYWSETRQPLNCLVFLAPLLCVYEAGVLWVGGGESEIVRNGADSWMRSWLHQLGFDQPWLLPLLVVAGLLVWHVVGKYPGRVSIDTLSGMFAESLLFAFVLIVVGKLTDLVFQEIGRTVSLAISARSTLLAVTYIGAGIYEEVLFRLCLLPLCYGFFRVARLEKNWATVLAILSTSLAFSLAHYVGATGEPFQLFSFAFRTLAGLVFAALFVLRGFGISVGCHAAYDLLVGVMLQL